MGTGGDSALREAAANMAPRNARRRCFARLWVCGASMGAVLVAASHLGYLDALNFAWTDLLWASRSTQTASDQLRIVIAADPDWQSLGYWPPPSTFPPRLLCRTIETLSQAGARAVVIDLIVPQQGAGAEELRLTCRRVDRRGTRVVATVGESGAVAASAPPVCHTGLSRTLVLGADGRVRWYEWYARTAYGPRYSLVGEAVRVAFPERFATLEGRAPPCLQMVYSGPPGSFPLLPLADLLRGNIPREWLAGRAIILGRADQTYPERFATPTARRLDDALMLGAEIHANALAQLLRWTPLARAGVWLDSLMQLVAITLAAVLCLRVGPVRGTIVALVVMLAVGTSLGVALLDSASYAMTFGPALLAVGAMGLAFELQERGRLIALFGPYVGRTLAARMKGTQRPTLGGEVRQVSLLIMDIHGSTRAAATTEPERLADLLNELFTRYVAVVWQHGGVISKYLGDGLLAIFGAPADDPEHAAHAVAAAREIAALDPVLAAAWERVTGAPLATYSLVHSGPALVGAIGSLERMEYTAIGDTVNVAFRLMARVGREPGQVFATTEALARAGLAASGAPLTCPVEGHPAGVTVHAVCPPGSQPPLG